MTVPPFPYSGLSSPSMQKELQLSDSVCASPRVDTGIAPMPMSPANIPYTYWTQAVRKIVTAFSVNLSMSSSFSPQQQIDLSPLETLLVAHIGPL